jgi:cytochrome b561
MTDARPLRYDATTIRLHWATAALVVLLWSVAQIIDWFPIGPARWNVRSLHMLLGLALGVVLVWRLWWRATRGQRLQPTSGAGNVARRAVHAALYALLATVLVLGVANVWVRGDHVFGWFKVPALVVSGLDLRHTVGDLHRVAATTVLALAGLHAAAALVHHFVLRDGILARMLPRLAASRRRP